MIIMTLLVRDEQDILATNIDFHLSQGIDKIIVTNNLSVDRTADILNEYVSQGVIHLINENSDDYNQQEWVTKMAKIAIKEYQANWVLHCDADEFWMPNNKSQTISDVLKKLPNEVQVGSANRVNFLPPERKQEEQYFAISMNIREAQSFNAIGQPLPPKICHRSIKNICILQGNHHVEEMNVRITPVNLPITILHFPLRSYSHFENKINLGGAAYERNTVLDKNLGSTWRSLYKLHLDGELKSYYKKQRPKKKDILRLIKDKQLIKDHSLLDYIESKLDFTKLSTQYGNKKC